MTREKDNGNGGSVHPAEFGEDRLLESCDVRRQRRSGPGGQHRNKVETAVVLVHRPTGIRAEATERRSQHENRRVAVGRLRVSLALQVRRRRVLDEGPSPRWRSRCQNRRLRVNPSHEDFPALLAEALDVLEQFDHDARAAAGFLAVTTSQLVRFLKLEPRAFLWANERRTACGRPRLL